jgi:hypothetical protein
VNRGRFILYNSLLLQKMRFAVWIVALSVWFSISAFAQANRLNTPNGYELLTVSSGAPIIDNDFLAAGGGETTSEEQSQIIVTRTGKLVNLYTWLNVAPGDTSSRTFTVRKNGMSTLLSVTLKGAKDVRGSDTTHSIPVAPFDMIAIQVTSSGKPSDAMGIASFELAY